MTRAELQPGDIWSHNNDGLLFVACQPNEEFRSHWPDLLACYQFRDKPYNWQLNSKPEDSVKIYSLREALELMGMKEVPQWYFEYVPEISKHFLEYEVVENG